MSEQPMSSTPYPTSSVAGYYGKIPLAGDFITRRVAQNTIAIWDNWLRHGLYEVKNAQSSAASLNWIEQYHTSAVWNFVMPAAICGEQLIGLIAASSDRVGRQFPFTLFKSLSSRNGDPLWLDHITPFFMCHGPIVRALQQRQLGLEQLEQVLDAANDWQPDAVVPTVPPASSTAGDIFAVLNESGATDADITIVPPPGGMLPWPGLSLAEVMQGNASYWWTNQTAGGPLRAFTHHGGLNETLFKILFSSLSR